MIVSQATTVCRGPADWPVLTAGGTDEFQSCPGWVPSLDGSVDVALIILISKDLDRFERVAF